jgi:thiosulfate/3-mercaptopyruvate sulfurtransferase
MKSGVLRRGFAIVLLFVTLISAGELSSRMVSTGWLRTNLNKDHVRILDVRSVSKYYVNHIPRASYLNAESLRLSINGVPYLPISHQALASLLGEIGISESSTIIVYGSQDDLQTFYIVWLLDYIGHKDVAILEGGYEKWERENRPLTQDLPDVEQVKYQMPSKLVEDIRVDKKNVLKSISNGTSLIIDVASPKTYAGIDGLCKRKGHIKGAINHFWKNDIENLYQWKNIDFLRRSYSKAPSNEGKKVILVCEDGWSAAHTYFTLRYIIGETNIALYDGGMGEWANSNDLPMETNDVEVSAVLFR